MKELLSRVTLRVDVLIITLFLSFFSVYLFFQSVDFILTDFSKLYISRATLDEYDVSVRIGLFYKLIFIGALTVPLFYVLLFKISLGLHKLYLKVPVVLSAVGIVLVMSNLYGIISLSIAVLLFVLVLIQLLFIMLFKQNIYLKILVEPVYYIKVLVITFLMQSAVLFLGNADPFISEQGVWLFFIIYVVLNAVFILINKKTNTSFNSIFKFCLPLVSVPLLIFISTESFIYFKIKSAIEVNYRLVFVIGLIIFIVSTLLSLKLRRLKIKSNNMFKLLFIPASFISFFILTIYSPLVAQSTEMFELANSANAQMRMFHFSELPFVDFMSSHMFSEQFYGIIYHLLYGYNGSLDFVSYLFLYDILHLYFIIYSD